MRAKEGTCWYLLAVKNDFGIGNIGIVPVYYKDGTKEKVPNFPHLLVVSETPWTDPWFDPRDRPESDFDNITSFVFCETDFEIKRWRKKTIELDCEMRSSEKSKYMCSLFQSKDENGILRRNTVLFETGTVVMCME